MLPPAHREIIDLVYYHEKSVAEVREIVGNSSEGGTSSALDFGVNAGCG
jgi:hypothetical protein